eukprot:3255413-Lingulodinium_polyedra.AAC.1
MDEALASVWALWAWALMAVGGHVGRSLPVKVAGLLLFALSHWRRAVMTAFRYTTHVAVALAGTGVFTTAALSNVVGCLL